MRSISIVLQLDEHADPPTTTIRIDDGTSPSTAASPVTAAEWVAILGAVKDATGLDVLVTVEPDLQDALTRLRGRIAEADAQQEARRAAEAAWTPVIS